MKYRRCAGAPVLAALILAVSVVPVSASTVSFLVVETGLHEGIASSRYSSLWEGGLMETFFNAGHIVTNSPIARMEKRPAQDLIGTVRSDFYEASFGGAEYFILSFLNHTVQGSDAIPTDITIKIYKTGTSELVFQRSFPAGKGKTLDEEYLLAQNAGRIIVSQIKE